MGGIPFQSPGCSTCRKRKIKCDLGKPECSRCIKKGTHCPGYVKNRNILSHRLVSQHTRHGLANRPIAHLTENPYSVLPRTELNTNTEVRTQIFAGFMNSLFTHNTLLEGRDDSWYMLMARFPSMAGESELLDRSVISLAATFLAKKTDDHQLKRHGVEIYNSAIAGLARMLQRNCKASLEMFYAMIIFHTYELMQTSEDMLRNCSFHVQGATAILKHLNCTDSKEKSFLQAMLIRQKWAATFFILNKNYRSQVNWECFFIGTEASPLDRLFGIIAESAFVQLSLDRIEEHCSPNIKEEYTLLLCRCQEIEENLGYWLSSYASSLGGRPTPGERHLEYDPRTIPLKTAHAPYEFSSLTTAKTYLLFWVALLVVRRAFYHIERFLGKAPNLSPMLFCADEICKSTAFCMQPKHHISAVQITLFAVSQAAQCYIDCGDVESYTWCQNVYPIGKPSGFTTVQIFASRSSDQEE